jgi:microsomal dipeptidase-like Zn-dependent dipeptidase
MASSNRRTFLGNTLLATFGSVLVPRSVKAAARSLAKAVAVRDPARYVPSSFGIVDLHCHPSLKIYLWGRKLWKRHTPGLGVNAFDLQDDVEQLTTGTVPRDPPPAGVEERNGLVKGIVVAHYLPEEGIHEKWDILKGIYPWIGRFFRKFADKIEHGDLTNTGQVLHMIELMEQQAEIACERRNGTPFVIARSFQEFSDAIENGQFPIAHAIEGAHALGRNLDEPSDNKGRKNRPRLGMMHLGGKRASSQYIKNLEILKSKGVCMMTLAHLFQNDIAYCVEGISPDEKASLQMKWVYDNTPEYNRPLTEVGVDVVNWMLCHGMIIDLTHSTPATRAQIFQMNRRFQRPLVFTHTGAQFVFNKHDKDKYGYYRYPSFQYYCVTDDEIREICACGGTIGVIPEVFWLAGGDTRLRRKDIPPKFFRNGIPYMVETIQYINSKTPNQDYCNISIGTDFDGYSDAPQDLYEASQLDALIMALRADQIHDDNIRKIMSGNALRVLKNGWFEVSRCPESAAT